MGLCNVSKTLKGNFCEMRFMSVLYLISEEWIFVFILPNINLRDFLWTIQEQGPAYPSSAYFPIPYIVIVSIGTFF